MARPAHPEGANLLPNHLTWKTRWGVKHFADITLGLECLEAIEHERKRIGLDVLAYCLMPDHFHLIIGPCELQVGYVVQALKLASVHLLMVTGRADGGLWQRGYYDVALRDSNQIKTAIDYVHYNPTVAALIDDPVAYPLSSLSAWTNENEGVISLAREKLVLF